MKVLFKLLDEDKEGILPNDKIWINFHITKHLIVSFDEEGYRNDISKNRKEINSIMKKQREDFSCSIKGNLQGKELTCNKCKFVSNCSDLLSDLKDEYFSLIQKTLTSDIDNPRHALCFDIKRSTETLFIVSEDGKLIISTPKNYDSSAYIIKTCYRPPHTLDPNFKALANSDDHWNRINTIKSVENKIHNPQNFKSVEKVLMENWS